MSEKNRVQGASRDLRAASTVYTVSQTMCASASVAANVSPLLPPQLAQATIALTEQGMGAGVAEAATEILESLPSDAGQIGSGVASGSFGSASALRTAASEVAGCAGRAAGVGALVEGVVGAYEAVSAYRAGEVDGETAVAHVAAKAAGGALSSGAAVVAGAAFTAVTGGTGPIVVGVGLVAMTGVRWLWERNVRILPDRPSRTRVRENRLAVAPAGA